IAECLHTWRVAHIGMHQQPELRPRAAEAARPHHSAFNNATQRALRFPSPPPLSGVGGPAPRNVGACAPRALPRLHAQSCATHSFATLAHRVDRRATPARWGFAFAQAGIDGVGRSFYRAVSATASVGSTMLVSQSGGSSSRHLTPSGAKTRSTVPPNS